MKSEELQTINTIQIAFASGGRRTEDGERVAPPIMVYGNHPYEHAKLTPGHVGYREFRRAMLAVEPDWKGEYRYEYAVFRDDESIVMNVRPDETDARPVTIAYFGMKADQP